MGGRLLRPDPRRGHGRPDRAAGASPAGPRRLQVRRRVHHGRAGQVRDRAAPLLASSTMAGPTCRSRISSGSIARSTSPGRSTSSNTDHNSRWLMPCRFYEAGYYGVPAWPSIASRSATSSRSIASAGHSTQPLEDSLVRFFERLTETDYEHHPRAARRACRPACSSPARTSPGCARSSARL